MPELTRRRLLLTAVAALVAVALAGLVWVLVTGLLARSRLTSAQTDARHYAAALVAGDSGEARRLGAHIQAETASAHALTSGPAWWVGSNILVAGSPLRTTREVSADADQLAQVALPRLPAIVSDVVDRHRAGGTGSIDVQRLGRAAAEVDRIGHLVQSTESAVRSTPGSWFGPVHRGREQLLAKLHQADTATAAAGRALHVLTPMLGADHTQRYFVGFLNEAESRSVGGLPGAFAIVTVDHGKVAIEHVGSDVELEGVRAHVDLGREYDRLYGQDDPAGVVQNSDIGPQFPDAARIWAGMWQTKSGQHVDGALAIDPTALGYLMRVTGPARLPDGTVVTAQNIASLTQSREYALFPGFDGVTKNRRSTFLATIADAVSAKLLRVGSPVDLLSPLRQAVSERRIVVWSDDAQRERAIVSAGLGGVVAADGHPLSAFLVNNAAGGKMDYYLRRSMTYRASGCGSRRTATATFTITNVTPPGSLPAYVTYVAGGRPAGAKAGFNRLIVTHYSTPGSHVRSVTLDGRPQHLSAATEDGLTSVRLMVDLPAGATRTLRVVTDEPARAGPVRIVRQPLVNPLRVSEHVPACVLAAASSTASGPASTGSSWPTLLVGLAGLVVVLLAAAALVRGAAGGSSRQRRRLDALRARAVEGLDHGGALLAAALVAIIALAVTVGVIALLGLATKTSALITPDRPIYRFFLDHRAGWLTHALAVITRVGEYPEATAIALAAAVVLAFTRGRARRPAIALPAFVLLAALLTWPFVSLGRFYDVVAAVAVVVLLVLAVARADTRGRFLAAAVLAGSILLEKPLQMLITEAVHGTAPPLSEAFATVGPYPSGGCARVVLVLGLAALLFAREFHSRRPSVLLALAATLVCYAEGYSSVYLGTHWFVDCLGGLLFGAGLLLALAGGLRCYLGPVPGAITEEPAATGTSGPSALPAGR